MPQTRAPGASARLALLLALAAAAAPPIEARAGDAALDRLVAAYPDFLAGHDGAPVPLASSVARLAAERFAHGEVVDAALAAPLYVRDKVALTTAERLASGGKA